MSEFHIDTDGGQHAAAEIEDGDLVRLCGMVLYELAVRLDEEQFADYLERIREQRRANEGAIAATRHERDLMRFAAEVMLDIQRLPEIDHAGR